MKDVVISKKAWVKKRRLEMRNADKMALVEVVRTTSLMDLDGKYMWTMSNIDIDAVRDLGLTNIIKH